MDNRKFLPIIFIVIAAIVFVVSLSSSIFYTIESGERGVIFYKITGLDKEDIKEPGFHYKAPWNDLHRYDVKEKNEEEKMDVLDRNGLSISVDVTLRYHPIYDRIGFLHEEFGTGYQDILVVPEARSAVRQVMGRYSAEEIYSTKRAEVETSIKIETEKSLKQNNIQMKELLIRSIKLPEQIKSAIEKKLKEEQEALAYQYRLSREESEAKRKLIAAKGEAEANNIVNNSLTDKLLKMRGIEATQELSKSPNSKVVVIGSGKDGLPLILGGN